jgi:hypothetical protein
MPDIPFPPIGVVEFQGLQEFQLGKMVVDKRNCPPRVSNWHACQIGNEFRELEWCGAKVAATWVFEVMRKKKKSGFCVENFLRLNFSPTP